jgi:hypothetical protein
MLFVTGVAMHEAARADYLSAPGVSRIADRLIAKHGKKSFGFKSSSGTSRTEHCTHGEDDITVCSDCDPDGVCVVTRCVDGRTGLATECP